MDDFDDAGGIAGRWLSVQPGMSPTDSTASPPSKCVADSSSGMAANPSSQMMKPVIDACARGDEHGVSMLLDALPFSRLELLADAVSAARDKHRLHVRQSEPNASRAQGCRAATSASSVARTRNQPASQSMQMAATQPAIDDELDGAATIAGRWLEVPVGGVLPETAERATAKSTPSVQASVPFRSALPRKAALSMDCMD
mmetsp:Transcript_50839/g.108563  ORF Transcript_50839/g.108563 Transcript_50839/m.108563 type:complete len:200 (+) Transcript_50839:32-631(+)